ncbi:transposase [Hymenobacter terricola]|uniref:transposase n=1 Tax=Hymenobacter terricola TaxID=2819236 RepID=UPI001B30FCD0|nr:transposase [Hymenobacter terricola]
MAHKDQKQFRLPTHNYGRSGVYFITICVLNRTPAFGNITNGQMALSQIGETVSRYWQGIPTHYVLARLDQWVIMPDHFHGLLILKPNGNDSLTNQEDATPAGLRPLRPASVPAIINQFKGSVKRWCNQHGYEDFAWQSRYHDHIVRNVEALGNIREYIIRNPKNWDPDKIDW